MIGEKNQLVKAICTLSFGTDARVHGFLSQLLFDCIMVNYPFN